MDTTIGGISSPYQNGTYTDTTANSLENKLNHADLSTATDEELMEVCKDFEEYFAEQMIKSMMKMAKVDSSEDENDYSAIFGLSNSSDSFMSTMSNFYGDQMVTKLSGALCGAENGSGLGLAQTLYEQMKRNYSVPEEEAVKTV